MSNEHLAALFRAVSDAKTILILPHNNPDPDAIASAVAARYLLAEKAGLESLIAYQGIIGRAENRALVRYLGHPLRPMMDLGLQPLLPIALVDTQPGAGNVTLPPQSGVAIVIDHHTSPDTPRTPTASYTDIRPELGATATILTEYLRAADLEPSPALATALFYGIKTNTMGLGRNASPADTAAYFFLQSRINVTALAEIEQAQVPAAYFKSFDVALRAARIYGDIVVSYLGPMEYPDLTAEMADLLLRLDKSQWVICLGVYKDVLMLSVRTRRRQGGAGRLIQAIVGDEGACGGHGALAGGQVPLAGRNPERVLGQLRRRALRYLQVAPKMKGKTLI